MATHDDVRAAVNTFLKERMDVHITEGEDAIFWIESAMTVVSVNEWLPDEGTTTIISIDTPFLWHVPQKPEIYKWIALHNDDYVIGRFSVSEDEDNHDEVIIGYSHRLIGDSWTENELYQCVSAMTYTVNQVCPELKHMFGGKDIEEVRAQDNETSAE